MKIRSIQLKNFRCFEDQAVEDLGQINAFGGTNWSGKSTILDAIAVCLTGTCRGAEGGRGLDELRRYGSKRKWQVVVKLDDGTELVRTEGDGQRSKVHAEIEAKVGPADQVRACLYSGELMRLDKKARQQLVLALAQPGAVDVPEEIRQLVPGMPAQATLAELERFYDRVYEQRREVGAELRGIGSIERPKPPEHLADKLEGATSERVAAGAESVLGGLRKLRRERDELVAAGTVDTGRAARVAATKAALDQARAQLAEAEQVETKDLGPAVDELDAKRKELAARYQDLTQQRHQAEAQKAAAVEQFEFCDQGHGTCPTCGTKLAKKAMGERKAALVKELDVIKKGIEAVQEKQAEVRAQGQDLEQKRTALRMQAAEYERAQDARVRLGERVAALEADLQREAATEDEPHQEVDQEVLAALDQRIRRGETLHQELVSYGGVLEQYERQAERQRVLSQEHAQLDQLVQQLGPQGPLRAKAGESDELSRFQSFMAAQLKGLGFPCDLRPLLACEDDPIVRGIPARMLSTSEQKLFSIAFQLAAAKWSGLGIVAVDDYEHLDPHTGAQARNILTASDCQVFMFQVLRDREAFLRLAVAANRTADIRCFLVEEGKVSLPRGEAA